MKNVIHFIKRNKIRLLVWIISMIATIPVGLWCGSKTWHGMRDFFSVTTLTGDASVLMLAVVVTFGVVIAIQIVVTWVIKKLF